MAVAMEFLSGNTKISIRDDCCAASEQAERDAAIKKRLYRNALLAIRRQAEGD